MLEVTIWNTDGEEVLKFDDADEVEYVSLVNNETFGPPALVAPNRGEPPKAKIDDHVLYINTNLIPLFKIVRTTD